MRDIDAAADSGHERAIIARDMLIHGIRKYIGSYAAVMNGVDVIVFTAGIGENGAELREKVMEGFEFMAPSSIPSRTSRATARKASSLPTTARSRSASSPRTRKSSSRGIPCAS